MSYLGLWTVPTFLVKFKLPSVVVHRAGHFGGIWWYLAIIFVRSGAKSLTDELPSPNGEGIVLTTQAAFVDHAVDRLTQP